MAKDSGLFDLSITEPPIRSRSLEQLHEELSAIHFVKQVVTPFHAVDRNLRDLELALNQASRRIGTGDRRVSHSFGDALSELAEMARLLGNFLAAASAFFDQADHALSSRFGDESSERKTFNSMRSRSYDNVVGYRLMTRLRNYAQHFGAPFSSLNFNIRPAADVEDLSEAVLLLNKDQLLAQSFKWGAIVKRDLESLSTDIDLMPMIYSFMFEVQALARHLILTQNSKLNAAEARLRELKIRSEAPEGATVVLWVGDRHPDGRPPSRSEILPYAELEFVQEVLRRAWPDIARP